MAPTPLDFEKIKVHLTEYFLSDPFEELADKHQVIITPEIAFLAATAAMAVFETYEIGLNDAAEDIDA